MTDYYFILRIQTLFVLLHSVIRYIIMVMVQRLRTKVVPLLVSRWWVDGIMLGNSLVMYLGRHRICLLYIESTAVSTQFLTTCLLQFVHIYIQCQVLVFLLVVCSHTKCHMDIHVSYVICVGYVNHNIVSVWAMQISL